MARRPRKLVLDLLRIAICVGALWYVLRGVSLHDHVVLDDGTTIEGIVRSDSNPLLIELRDGETQSFPFDHIKADSKGIPQVRYGLLSAWQRSGKILLLLSILVYFPVAIPLAQRFRMLLAIQKIELTFAEALRLTFAGNFLNFTTPLGSNAGDLFKAYFASLHTHRKTEAVTTVLLDRLIGLATLIVVAAAITLFAPASSRLAELRPYMLCLLLVGAIAAGLYFSPVARLFSLPSGLRRLAIVEQAVRVDQAVRLVARHGWTLSASVLLTVLLQVMALGSYFVAAVGLAMYTPVRLLPEYFAYFYAGALIQSLPGPPQGLGTVELAYRYFFADYGSPSQIVCLAFAIRLVALVSSLPGLFVVLTGAYKPSEAEESLNSPSANCSATQAISQQADLIGSSKPA